MRALAASWMLVLLGACHAVFPYEKGPRAGDGGDGGAVDAAPPEASPADGPAGEGTVADGPQREGGPAADGAVPDAGAVCPPQTWCPVPGVPPLDFVALRGAAGTAWALSSDLQVLELDLGTDAVSNHTQVPFMGTAVGRGLYATVDSSDDPHLLVAGASDDNTGWMPMVWQLASAGVNQQHPLASKGTAAAVWSFSEPSAFWAVGDFGALWRVTSGVVQQLESKTTADLHAVTGGVQKIYIAGAQGTLLALDVVADKAAPLCDPPLPSALTLRGVAASVVGGGVSVAAVGNDATSATKSMIAGVIFDGVACTTVAFSDPRAMRDLWIAGDGTGFAVGDGGTVFAVGDGGAVFRRSAAGSITLEALQGGAKTDLRSVWGGASAVYAAGAGAIYRRALP